MAKMVSWSVALKRSDEFPAPWAILAFKVVFLLSRRRPVDALSLLTVAVLGSSIASREKSFHSLGRGTTKLGDTGINEGF